METQMSTLACSRISRGQKKKKKKEEKGATADITPNQFLNIKLLKNGICSNAQGHWRSAAKAMLMSHQGMQTQFAR